MPSPAASTGFGFLTTAWSAELFNAGSSGGLVSWLGTLPECSIYSISYSLLWNLPIVCVFKKMCLCVCACVYYTSTQGSQKRWLDPLELELVNRQLWAVLCGYWELNSGSAGALCVGNCWAVPPAPSALVTINLPFSSLVFCRFHKLTSRLNCSCISYKNITMACFHCITIPLWNRGLNLSVVQVVFALLSRQASCALCLFFSVLRMWFSTAGISLSLILHLWLGSAWRHFLFP